MPTRMRCLKILIRVKYSTAFDDVGRQGNSLKFLDNFGHLSFKIILR